MRDHKNIGKIPRMMSLILLIAWALGLPGCNHETTVDFTYPEITIISPEPDVTYPTMEVNLEYTIKETNFREAWYILNDGEKVSIPREGTRTLSLETGAYKLVLGAQDNTLNTSRDSVFFYVDVK